MWKGYAQRKKVAQMRKDELVFIGMVPNSQPVSHKNSAINQAKKTEVGWNGETV